MARKTCLKAALKKHQEKQKNVANLKKKEEETNQARLKHKDHVNNSLQNVFRWSDGMVTNIPFRNGRIFLVGEGDLSFSLALSKLLKFSSIIATVFDSEDSLYVKYPQAAAHVKELTKHTHQVHFGVDARKMSKKFNDIDVIVFNFPHTGSGIKDRDRNIRGNQMLLANFFSSAAEILHAASSQHNSRLGLTVSRTSMSVVADNQKDADEEFETITSFRPIPMIILTMWSGEPYDSWRPKQLARAAGLHCIASFSFEPSKFPGYKHCRTDGGMEPDDFCRKPARTHIFTLIEHGETVVRGDSSGDD